MIFLAIFGFILAAVGGIWTLVLAFRESVLWGIGCLLIPLVSLIFVITHWDDAMKPFLIQLGGVVLIVVSGVMNSGNA
ncbi:MAG TPA: hypothetical protein VJS20_01995 [Gemmatimonadales bacterium]|nr:hypothetical protein [Gemmatimonadales bacterium]